MSRLTGWRRLAIAGTVAACLLPAAAGGGGAPATASTAELRYQASWAGIPAGDVVLRLDTGEDGYVNRIAIETVGLVKTLIRFRAEASSRGQWAGDGLARPESYDADYVQRKKRKRVNLDFIPVDERGSLAVRGPGDTNRKALLPEALRRNVVDPLSALAAIRHRLLGGDLAGGYVVPVFDGRRRLDVAVGPARPAEAAAGPDKPLQVELVLQPVAGFETDGPDDEQPDPRPRSVILTVSGDGRFLPLKAEFPVAFLPTVVSLVEAGR